MPFATFGLRIDDGKVVEAAPIARWTIGKDHVAMRNYFLRRGARIEEVHT